MPVCCRFREDWILQAVAANNGRGAQIEYFFQFLCDFAVGKSFHFAGTICVDIQADRMSNSDGISHLYQYLAAQSGSHQVFGNVPGSVGRRAVHLGRVFSTESAAAMGAFAAVSIDDDFTAGQSGIAVRSADDKLAGWIDIILHISRK